MAAGALVSMPLTGHILDGRSSASVTRVATLIFCLMLPLPLLATSPYMLGAILFVFGASNGAMDVAMNAHGVALERQLPKPIMSSLHGGWSVGGFVSAGLVAIAAAAGVDPRLESLLVGVALWLWRSVDHTVDWEAHPPTPRRGRGSRCPRVRSCCSAACASWR